MGTVGYGSDTTENIKWLEQLGRVGSYRLILQNREYMHFSVKYVWSLGALRVPGTYDELDPLRS
jgi:hypothetical protein